MSCTTLNYSPLGYNYGNNAGFNSRSNDCSPPAIRYAPSYEGVRNSDVARDFARNFNYFEEGNTGFTTRQGIADYAARPLGRNPEENQRIMLAKHIDNDPVLAEILDSMIQNGRQDGLISMGDVLAAIDMFDAQECGANNYTAPPTYQRSNFGTLQQYRVDNQCCSQYPEQPSTMQQSWASNQYDSQYPEQSPIQNRSNYIPQSSYAGPGPYSHEEKKDFSPRLLAHFAALEDPSSPGNITDRSLNYVVSTGHRLDGSPATQEDIAIARELLDNRPKDFRRYDEADGVLDGKISRSSIAAEMDRSEFSTMPEVDLLKIIKEHFSELRGRDGYASVNDLKEAAGEIPSTRTFTPEARQAATELLARLTLLEQLDVGTNNNGGNGYLDQRFDLDNLNYMIQKKTTAAAG